jgi:predicted nucleic acid binding AN1-type Zn finger protein
MDNSQKPKKIRCQVCKKKLGLLPFVCNCELHFCSKHRAPEDHNCTYNFKEAGCKILEKNLIKVVNEKISAI